MPVPTVYTLDFETFAIENRPDFPPEAVGLAMRRPDGEAFYGAYGHVTGGNIVSRREVEQWLHEAWGSGLPILFHNASFDLSVAYEKFGMPELPWDRVHDTMFLAFLCDPHARKHDLKSLAETYLGMPPEERDAIGEWLWEHRVRLREEFGLPINRGSKGVANAGKFIAYAPGHIVAPYAKGDVVRTYGIFEVFYEHVVEAGMLPAYDRERQILPILMENERLGMRVDQEGLEIDLAGYAGEMERADNWLRKRLNAPSLNIDADREIAEAFQRERIIDEKSWTVTKSGQLSVSKVNLRPSMYLDQQVASVFGYRNRLATCMKMFMEPWLEQARRNDGFICTHWNQTRSDGGGTRTGRPSTSNPNFLNISKDFTSKGDGYVAPDWLEPLPLVRKYILPDDDNSLFLHRDFDGQELRVFAHFEDGPLCAAYQADASTDPHSFVQKELLAFAERAGSAELADRFQNRTNVKIMNFQSLYGGGVPALMAALDCDRQEADAFKRAHGDALPGLKQLQNDIKAVVASGEPIVTWGGRIYYPEEPGFSKKHNRWMTYEYKLINYLIQGSAADLTKQAIIDWYNHPQRDPLARFLVTVYDEINISCPEEIATEQMLLLKEVMEERRLDVPMKSSGKFGISWGQLEKCE